MIRRKRPWAAKLLEKLLKTKAGRPKREPHHRPTRHPPPRTDMRRDPAYTIFYMGINVGAATASIICGFLGQTYGWEYGFGLAGIGMLIGLIFFIVGKPLLLGKGEPKDPARIAGGKEWLIYGAGLGMVALCWAAIQYQDLVGLVLGAFGGLLITYVLAIVTFRMAYDGWENAPRGPFITYLASSAALIIGIVLLALGNANGQYIAGLGGVGILGTLIQQGISKSMLWHALLKKFAAHIQMMSHLLSRDI